MDSTPMLLYPTSADKQKRTLSVSSLGLLACFRRRRIQYLVFLLALPVSLWLLWILNSGLGDYARILGLPVSRFHRGGDPPNYYEWHEREKALPQNNPDLIIPQGRQGRYLRFRNHLSHVGWGNVMQEMIADHHLTYKANRIFVMYNYTWDKHAEGDYSQFGDHKIPARIPISALVAGPLAGGEYPESQWRPPAVTSEFFDLVCPHPTIVNVDETKEGLSDASAATIFDAFVTKLNEIDDNCVDLKEESGQILDFFIFGSGERMADAWPQFLDSPVITGWQWSSLVTSIVTQNRELIHPAIQHTDIHQRTELKGLLALHLRRGDFKEHCENLSNWRWGYNAFNVRPDFPDQFEAPPLPPGGGGTHTEEMLEWYNDHCYPDIPKIVERVKAFVAEAKSQGRAMNRIYMLTNGEREWIQELKEKMRDIGKWESVITSRDLKLDWDQEFVKQAADMLIATRAEVFVGNAWSSLSSNVNLLRISQNHDPETSRFW